MSSALAELIASILAETGESEQELAARLGVSKDEIHMLEVAIEQSQSDVHRSILGGWQFGSDRKDDDAWQYFTRLRKQVAHRAEMGKGSDESVLMTLLAMQQPPSESMVAAARKTIARLIELLDLSLEQVATILGVAIEQVVEWTGDRGTPPAYAVAELHQLDDALSTLEHLFNPERIPQIIRRPAELFGGESALDLILRGDLPLVVAKYDESLHYAR